MVVFVFIVIVVFVRSFDGCLVVFYVDFVVLLDCQSAGQCVGVSVGLHVDCLLACFYPSLFFRRRYRHRHCRRCLLSACFSCHVC